MTTVPDATPEARDLAELIWHTSRGDESTISAMGADVVAGAILSSGWLAQRDAHIRAEALREARAIVERQTDLTELVLFDRPSDFCKGVLTCLAALDAAIKEAQP